MTMRQAAGGAGDINDRDDVRDDGATEDQGRTSAGDAAPAVTDSVWRTTEPEDPDASEGAAGAGGAVGAIAGTSAVGALGGVLGAAAGEKAADDIDEER